jgi:hypothetical protein
MSKHFFMQFYPGEWLSDAKVSQCRPATRGIWWDAISAMHGIDRCGQLSGTIEALARVCRCRVDEMRAAIDDLRLTGAADVTECSSVVTLVNRRMRREFEDRQAVKNRVDRHRQLKKQRECNEHCMPPVTDMQRSYIYNSDTNNYKNTDAPALPGIPSVESFQLAQKLQQAISARDPNSRAAKRDDLSGWARDIEALLKIDLRKPDEIEAAISWCQQPSSFWGPIILNGKKLRQKFDTIAGQMLMVNHGGKNGVDTKRDFSDGPPGSTSERRTSRGDRVYIPRQ